MRAASRESLTAARERLVAVTDGPPTVEANGASAGPLRSEDIVELAADLRAVTGLLAREPGLRRALSDPAAIEQARTGLLRGLLADRVSAPALTVLAAAVRSRWSAPVDLLDAVELLAVDAELIVAERTGALADVEDELFRFGRIVEGSPQLDSILADPAADRTRQVALIQDLLGRSAGSVTVRLVETAVHGLGGRGFHGSLQRLIELVAARRDREIAYVRVAGPLAPAQQDRLAAWLSARYGRQISLKIQVDPAVLGGMAVRIGDDLYDGSVARRLELVRTALAP